MPVHFRNKAQYFVDQPDRPQKQHSDYDTGITAYQQGFWNIVTAKSVEHQGTDLAEYNEANKV